MKDPKVAVVIPAKNAEKTLEKAFVSVLNQKTEEQIEVCIAVAPSEDSTLDVAKRIEIDNLKFSKYHELIIDNNVVNSVYKRKNKCRPYELSVSVHC